MHTENHNFKNILTSKSECELFLCKRNSLLRDPFELLMIFALSTFLSFSFCLFCSASFSLSLFSVCLALSISVPFHPSHTFSESFNSLVQLCKTLLFHRNSRVMIMFPPRNKLCFQPFWTLSFILFRKKKCSGKIIKFILTTLGKNVN